MKAKVYFCRDITPENVVKLYDLLGIELPGKVALKVHSGEKGNKNFLKPEFWKPMVERLNGTVVECNTAYPGARDRTNKHKKLLESHGWNIFDFDLLDAEGPGMELEIPNGNKIKKNYVGKNMANYQSMVVLSHFKGHTMGGYGGALKQLSIGCASTAGKAYIHSVGITTDDGECWKHTKDQLGFLESMADAACSVVKYFKGNMAFINVMKNISIDCDCDGNAHAPCMKDVGILASLDPIAIDQACLDIVWNSDDPGKDELIERIESRKGRHTLEAAEKLNFGSREYELVEVK